MTEYKPLPKGTTSLDLPKSQFIARLKAWIDEFNDGKPVMIKEGQVCPIDLYIQIHGACGKEMVSGLAECPYCGQPCCPEGCYNHNVTQLSRITGYIQAVDGWNSGKRQELKDRTRAENF